MPRHEATKAFDVYKRAGQQVICMPLCFCNIIFHDSCIEMPADYRQKVSLISMKFAKDWKLLGIFSFLF